MDDKTGGAAFPSQTCDHTGRCGATQGLTLLDYFAGAALPDIMGTPEQITKTAYDIADAMLSERARRVK